MRDSRRRRRHHRRRRPDLAEVEASFVAEDGDFVVAVVGGRILGMGGFRPDGEGRAEVLRVRVHPATSRLGVETAVMSELERRAVAAGVARLVLDTADNQPEAIAFYEAIAAGGSRADDGKPGTETPGSTCTGGRPEQDLRAFADRPVAHIEQVDVRRFMAEKQSAGLAPRSLQKIRRHPRPLRRATRLRPSELCGLKVGRLNLVKGTVLPRSLCDDLGC